MLQDGSETGHTIEGNLGIMTRESYTLTNSDTTPATFLISNPNNTVRFNRAAGSAGLGFWLRFNDNVDGTSVMHAVRTRLCLPLCGGVVPVARVRQGTLLTLCPLHV
jgi:hypothetical protein